MTTTPRPAWTVHTKGGEELSRHSTEAAARRMIDRVHAVRRMGPFEVVPPRR